jgi:very-short-patch-repair endonuclease
MTETKLKPPARLNEIIQRSPAGFPMPYTGNWEKANPELAARVWQCLTKNFQEYEDLIKSSAVYAESPIEEALVSALLTEDSAFYFEGPPILVRPGQAYEMPEQGGDVEHAQFIVAPQFRAAGYRIDIACAYSWTGRRIAVECDGHEFHEKTPEQASHDKERDRALLAAGWPTMRFTGSQIHKDPFACAKEIARFLENEDAYSPAMLIPESRR